MKETPILFSAPMVIAILENRKTQTRRIIKPQPVFDGVPMSMDFEEPEYWAFGSDHIIPRFYINDRLWVKETFKVNGTMAGPRVTYRADGSEVFPSGCPSRCRDWIADDHCWRPSIFMRRYASRLLLDITTIRAQRLQEISEEDCVEEGITPWSGRLGEGSAKTRYAKLWESINGAGSWGINPWVWAIEFSNITGRTGELAD